MGPLIIAGGAIVAALIGVLAQTMYLRRSARLALMGERLSVAIPVTDALGYLATITESNRRYGEPQADGTVLFDPDRVEAIVALLKGHSLDIIQPMRSSLYLYPPEVQGFIREVAEEYDVVIDRVVILLEGLRERPPLLYGQTLRIQARHDTCEELRLRGARLFLKYLGQDRFVGAGWGWRKRRRDFYERLDAEIDAAQNM